MLSNPPARSHRLCSLAVGISLLATLLICQFAHAQAFTHTTGSLSEARYNIGTAACGNLAFFAGGEFYSGYSSRVDIYNASTGTWTSTSLTQARGGPAAAAWGNIVMFAGGEMAGTASDVVDIYNTTTLTWSHTHLPVARSQMAATAVGGKLLFVGGLLSGGLAPTGRVDIYDTQTQTWSTTDLGHDRTPTAVAVVGRKAVFVGGYYNGNSVDIYDSATGSWSRGDTLNPYRSYGIASGVIGQKACFAGGHYWGTNDWVNFDTINIYDSATGNWSTDHMPWAGEAVGAASSDGRMLIFGGHANGQLDIYDPDAAGSKWSLSDPLSEYRGSMSTLTIGNTVIFAGGIHYGMRNEVDFYTIPEPATILIVSAGALLLRARSRRLRRKPRD